MKLPLCATLIRQLIAHRNLPETLTLRFPGFVIRVQSDSQTLIAILLHYFQPFVIDEVTAADSTIIAVESPPLDLVLPYIAKEPDPGKKRIKEEYVDLEDGRLVRKRLTGMIFVFGGENNLAIGPCLENSNQVINFVNNRYIAWQLERGCLLGHAAAIQQYGLGLVLAGFSGAGKSTLALHMMSNGATFTSNDRLLIHQAEGKGLRMFGVAKLPRINPGTALNNSHLSKIIPTENVEYFSCLSSKELWQLEHKYDVYLDQCFGPDRFVLEGTMSGLVILNWHHKDEPSHFRMVDIENRLDLLPAFMKSPGLFYLPSPGQPTLRSPEEYASLLKHVPVLEITGGVDFRYASAVCQDFLKLGKIKRTVTAPAHANDAVPLM